MSSKTNTDSNFFKIIQFPTFLVLSMWIVHIIKLSGGFNWGNYGLMAREADGLIGILTSPFLHGSLEHLISNSVPLFVLTLMISVFYKRIAYQSILLIYVLTGVAVWAFSRANVIHIGASGVVYGLVSFVFWSGIFRRNVKSIMLALIIVMLYSGLFLGVLPNQPGISWESHLFGGLVGILVAFWMKDRREKDENDNDDPWKDEKGSDEYFLPRDTFEETILERTARRRREQEGLSDSWTSNIS